jgi:putative peptidoglycan lipid II flippase
MLLACAAMVAVLLLGRWYWPDWTTVATWARVWHLAVMVGAGAATYAAVLFATGFRLRDLRAA